MIDLPRLLTSVETGGARPTQGTGPPWRPVSPDAATGQIEPRETSSTIMIVAIFISFNTVLAAKRNDISNEAEDAFKRSIITFTSLVPVN